MRDPTQYKTLSVRMPIDMARQIEICASALGKTQIDVICDAIIQYIFDRKHDPAFQERLRAHIEADLALLRSLEAPQ